MVDIVIYKSINAPLKIETIHMHQTQNIMICVKTTSKMSIFFYYFLIHMLHQSILLKLLQYTLLFCHLVVCVVQLLDGLMAVIVSERSRCSWSHYSSVSYTVFNLCYIISFAYFSGGVLFSVIKKYNISLNLGFCLIIAAYTIWIITLITLCGTSKLRW